MQQLIGALINRPVMSLRTGGQVATATQAIINPDNLKIEGFYCDDKFSKKQLVLLSQDIRDHLPQGYAVNDHDNLSEPVDLVRLKKVLEIDFQLIGKPVYTTKRKRLGRVNDFAVEAETMYIKKLYVGQPLIKSLTGGQLSVERNQIVRITSKRIVIQDPEQPMKDTETSPATAMAA